ncbi:MAG: glycosyltransferase family 4 protein [bacterium]|nr:glycosyltransferase family 4 protein [bacterium]MDT8365605.1 glycosyltransferase family 4 protein [bacterium]
MSRIPVVHVITKLEFGGAQQNTLYTVASLDRERFEPVLMTGPGGYLMPEALDLDLDLRVVSNMERALRPGVDGAAYRELGKLLEPYRGRPAIVHTHSSKAGILGRWAARKNRVPVIIHSIHGFGFTPAQSPPKRFLFQTAERLTSRITDHFIAVSESNRKDGARLGLFSPERCTLIRSGFDLDRFLRAQPVKPDLLLDLGIPHGSPLVLMVACLKPQKAPLDFVNLAALVHRDFPEVRFLLAGDGELRGTLLAEVDRLGLKGVFIAPGWREDIPELMKSSRVVVLTSRWEGLPRVIPQAKAAARPVVAAAVDGSVEAIREGVDGYLCPPGDVDSMAQRVICLLKDQGLADRMGREGNRVVDEWDQDQMVRKQEELYERLLREKNIW